MMNNYIFSYMYMKPWTPLKRYHAVYIGPLCAKYVDDFKLPEKMLLSNAMAQKNAKVFAQNFELTTYCYNKVI